MSVPAATTLPDACPLCQHAATMPYHTDRLRQYWHCPVCQLVFAGRQSLLGSDAELAIYQQHQNDPNDAGYRQFLSKLAAPLLQRLGSQALQGLDFGAGPGPTLYLLLEQGGHQVCNYDPYFAPDATLLKQQYDFICSTEAINSSPPVTWKTNLFRISGTYRKYRDSVNSYPSFLQSFFIFRRSPLLMAPAFSWEGDCI